jgi:signal transduction histidine kinase
MKKLILSIILFCSGMAVFAQQSTADSLERELKNYDVRKMELGLSLPTLADSIKVNLLLKIAGDLRTSDQGRSESYSRQSLSLSQQIDYEYGIARSYNAVAYHLMYTGKNDSALLYFKNTLTLAEHLKDSALLSASYNNIGAYYDGVGDYAEALKHYLSALRIREAIGSNRDLIGSYANIGNIYMVMNKHSDALAYQQKALEKARQYGTKYEIGDSYNGIANVYADMGKDSDALANYRAAEKIFLDNGLTSGIAFLYLNMGDFFRQQQKYDDALKYYIESLKYGKESGYDDYLSGVYIKIGAVYETLGRLEEAKQYISKGLSHSERAGKRDKMKEGYRILAMIYFKQKKYQPAFENEYKYAQLYDTIFHEEAQKNITEMKLQYEYDKKEAAIKAAQEKKNLVRNMIYAGLSIALLFLIVLLIQRSRIAKARRQMALEQERMRISRDLHDDLGSGLTGILMMSEQLQDSSPKELVSNNLERIKKSSRQMVEQMGEIVWAMNSKNDTLENLVGYLSTYSRDYFENIDVNHRVSLPETIPDVEMPGMKRRNVFLVIKESLNNIAKYAQATQVSLSMEIQKNSMSITLTDDGKGFDKENTRRFGNGLKNMKGRMEDIKGSFQIESGIGSGTTTVISFPIL